jgi:hypothetical protein
MSHVYGYQPVINEFGESACWFVCPDCWPQLATAAQYEAIPLYAWDSLTAADCCDSCHTPLID